MASEYTNDLKRILTSAIVTILTGERDADYFNRLIATAESRSISATTYAESGIVLQSRFGCPATHYLALYLTRAEVVISPPHG